MAAARSARAAQGRHAVSQVVGQLGEEQHFIVEEGLGLRGVDGQGPERDRLVHQRDRDARGDTELPELLAPGAHRGSVAMFLASTIRPVRMQVPVGPRPRSTSAQETFTVFE